MPKPPEDDEGVDGEIDDLLDLISGIGSREAENAMIVVKKRPVIVGKRPLIAGKRPVASRQSRTDARRAR